ncbi:arsenate reductase (glutaredoxin) [uncultured Marinobacter sp.]|uniref:arsenate reductase (glutaredoxin) n=1 Tax=uncultured Marinobacter sp. TaxID=187379 RepID=UPI0030DCD821
MTDITRIYHNPRCSKSRETLALLEERGIKPEIIRYLETPPNETELADLVGALGVKVRDIIRVKESEYKELGLDDRELSEQQLITALCATPKLIERPIVTRGAKAAIGRPPEAVLALF